MILPVNCVFQFHQCNLCGSSRLSASILSDKKKKELSDGPGLAEFIQASLHNDNIGENIIQKRGER